MAVPPMLMNYEQWIEYGIKQGWTSGIVCQTHDLTPMTDEEVDAWEDGYDPCIPILRLW